MSAAETEEKVRLSKPLLFEAAVLGLMAVLMAIQLFVPPIVGAADNGDFSRVAGPLGIYPPPELGDAAYFGWVIPEYRFDAGRIWVHGLCCYSSETLFGVASLPVGLAISPPGRFRLAGIGIVNALAFLIAVGLLLFATRPLPAAARILAGLLLLFFFTDVTYVSMFNSFYTEPAAIAFFFSTLALGLILSTRDAPPLTLVAAYFASALLLAASRPQTAMLGVLFALLGTRLAWREPLPRKRVFVAAAALAAAILSIAYSHSTPPALQRIYLYNAVFREMLTRSPDARKDLAELGLPSELVRLVGTSGFARDVPVEDPAFQNTFGKIGYGTLARFYASHPDRIWRALDRGAQLAFEMRPWALGNYTRDSGRPPGTQSRSFAAWSTAKFRFAPGTIGFVIAYLLLNLAAAVTIRARSRVPAVRRAADVWIVVIAAAAFQFGVASMMTALSRRSFFLFNVVCDLMLIALVLTAAPLFRRKMHPA